MASTHKKLWLCTLNEEGHARTCDYWYLVRADGSTPHTAFNRRASLMQWLEDRGLKLTAELPAHGEYSSQDLEGSYRTEMHGSYDAFFALQGERIRHLSNGQYTLGIITRDADGLRTVHYLNPNCRDRPTFDYFESRRMVG